MQFQIQPKIKKNHSIDSLNKMDGTVQINIDGVTLFTEVTWKVLAGLIEKIDKEAITANA
jgi:hypothetical protein